MAHLINNSNASVLQDNIQSIASSLSKIGAPDGVRLAILLLKRIDPSILIDELLSKGIIQAKSSKVSIKFFNFNGEQAKWSTAVGTKHSQTT